MSQAPGMVTKNEDSVRLLEPLLYGKFGNKISILDGKVENLVAFGENFSGNLYRISVKVIKTDSNIEEELHFVGKSIIVEEETIDWTILILKEAYMYTDIIELYASIGQESGIDDKKNIRNLFPYLCGYRLSLDPMQDKADKDAIVLLENIKVQGYYVLDKKIGLDFVHASEALKGLANFHATGIAAKIKYPSKFEKFIEQADKYGYLIDEDMIKETVQNFFKAVKTLPSHEKYIKGVEKALERRGREGTKLDAIRHDLWSTIAHYDYWTNNIMFRKDEATGEIDSLKIIDFQAYSFVDLFADIYYFMGTSLDDDSKFNRFDDLLEVYYEHLISSLESLNVDVSVYSKDKFYDQLKKDAWFELFHTSLALSFLLCEPGNKDRAAHLDDILTFKGGNLFSKKLEDLLKIYDTRGWLD